MDKPVHKLAILALIFCVTACSSHKGQQPVNQTADQGAATANPDMIAVVAALHDQMHHWEGSPYQWGGTQLKGVDCSGFVWRTLHDRFNMNMDRITTAELIRMGKPVKKSSLQPGDLVFFRIKGELHVGFYDLNDNFLHASSSQGVTRSSLNNPYWRSVYLEARRLPQERNATITLNG
ncbi:NlpC/P60 family protein [Pantoea sp. A4]|uniref:NlpC/P60 family protein n=1 Tax=Pantoea sp. A4 TaxID=1225184 RepID=UPI00037351AE